MPPALALLCLNVNSLKCSTTLHANADARQLKLAVADSSSTPNHVHALPTQLPDACPIFTSSTPRHATANACNNNNACAEPQLLTPLAPVLLSKLAHRVNDSMLPLADAFVLPLFHAVAELSSTPNHVHALPTQLPYAHPISTDSTTTDAIVSASTKLLACAVLQPSTPPVDVLHSPTALPHRFSIQ